jgi:hypothetical protein
MMILNKEIAVLASADAVLLSIRGCYYADASAPWPMGAILEVKRHGNREAR